MGSKLPLVSVIITNYNYDKYVQRCIESVLKQDYDHIQIIIIDDGSTDKSVEIINRYKGQYANVTVITQQNRGVVYTRNKGLKLVDGEYLIFIDSDDKIPRDFISKMLATAVKEQADVVCCDLKTDAILEVNPLSITHFLSFSATPICQLIRTKKIPSSIRFDKKLDEIGHEDIDFFFNLFLHGLKFTKCTDTQYLYNVHGSGRSPQISKTSRRHHEARMYIYNKHLPNIDRKDLHRALIDALIRKDDRIFEWIKVADERLDLIRRFQEDQRIKSKIIEEKDLQIEKQSNELSRVYSSIRYRTGRAVTYPIYFLKEKIDKS